MERYKNSVLQLICIRGVYNPFRPQMPPLDRKVSGTGFIVDIVNGLVITNAHVTSNAISVSGRMTKFGEYDLSLRVLSVCREKDIALCQLSKSDIDRILKDSTPGQINMIFGDNLLLKETAQVVTIGFPLGQKNVKFTSGVVSGFYANSSAENVDEENGSLLTEEEEPSYIQITAPINPGNSGGPLLNRHGEVVGVNAAGITFSQNIGYSIGSRTVLGIYDSLLAPLRDSSISTPYIVVTPKYAFEYNRASSALLELACKDQASEGVYVKRVYPNSVFDLLKEGDIITHVIYEDMYFNNSDAFKVVSRGNIRGTTAVASLDRYGDLIIDLNCQAQSATQERIRTPPGSAMLTSKSTIIPPCRKITVKELFDMIPIDSKVSLIICRQNADGTKCVSGQTCGIYQINTSFKYIPSSIRDPIYPRFRPYKYLIFAGMSVGELTMNHIAVDSDLKEYAKGKKRYEPRLVVNQIFPDTSAYHTKVFSEGSVIEEVNGTKVRTIDELMSVLVKSKDYITIVGHERDKLVVKKADALQEDAFVAKQFDLPNYKSPLE